MRFKDSKEIDDLLVSKKLPTFSFFYKTAICYFILFVVSDMVVSLLVPPLPIPTRDYSFYRISANQGMIAVLGFFVYAFITCREKDPYIARSLVAKFGLVLAFTTLVVQCNYLGAHLSKEGAEYSLAFAWIVIQTGAITYIGTLALVVARQEVVLETFWLKIELLLLFFALFEACLVILGRFGITYLGIEPALVAVSVPTLGYIFAKWSCDYIAQSYDKG